MVAPRPEVPDQTGETLPKRTTPTWEMEILLSGATVFTLFQAYAELNAAVFWLIDRLPPEFAGILGPLGLYVQGGVLGLALGFLAHLLLRAAWVALVGLRSVDPDGRLRENENLGPAQRAQLGESLDALPARIASLDDSATLVFGAALGLAKLMALLTMTLGAVFLVAYVLGMAFDLLAHLFELTFVLMALGLAPMMLATLVDNHAGKKGRPAPRWVERIIRAYGAAGYTADRNLGMTMATYRVAGDSRGWRAQLAIGGLVSGVAMVSLLAPVLQNRGIGGLLDGDFPSLRAGDAGAIRSGHYLDRQPSDELQTMPALPSDVLAGPYARLLIPYVPEWHDPPMSRCAPSGGKRWLSDAVASRGVLDCLSATQPIMLDGQPIKAPWWWSEDAMNDHRGFQVMIDLRALGPGPHLLEVAMPETARGGDEDEDVPRWRIPFWR